MRGKNSDRWLRAICGLQANASDGFQPPVILTLGFDIVTVLDMVISFDYNSISKEDIHENDGY